jgi:thiosulfate/3-mercaptopyruvate sulfurtransferase
MNPLVSIAWLKEHLSDPGLVVLDATLPPVGVTPAVDTHGRYLEQHIPGALFFDIEELSDHTTNLPHMLPSAEAFALAMSRMGISDKDRIVVYEQVGVFSAPRAWWMLKIFGAAQVFLLDGGLQGWIEAGLATEDGVSSRPVAEFQASLNRSSVTDLSSLQRILSEGGQVLDARSAGRFHGTLPEPRPGLSSGHMPGATSIPFMELLASQRMQSAEHLREYFREKQVDLNRPITTTCGSGVTAAVIAIALEIAGAGNVSLYDGSWAEYASQPDAPIVRDTNKPA